MSVASGRAKISQSARNLRAAWQRAAESWDDPVSRSIEQQHLEAIDRAVGSALRAMDAINEVLERVRRDCGDRP